MVDDRVFAPLPPDTLRTRGLDQQLQRLRTSARPLTTGFMGVGGRGSIRRGLWVLTACDHYVRVLARSTAQPQGAIADPALRAIVASAAETAIAADST